MARTARLMRPCSSVVPENPFSLSPPLTTSSRPGNFLRRYVRAAEYFVSFLSGILSISAWTASLPGLGVFSRAISACRLLCFQRSKCLFFSLTSRSNSVISVMVQAIGPPRDLVVWDGFVGALETAPTALRERPLVDCPRRKHRLHSK